MISAAVLVHSHIVQVWSKHLDRNEIAPLLQKVGDVKLGGEAAVLAVSHGFAIHPDVEGIVHTVKLQKNSAEGQEVMAE